MIVETRGTLVGPTANIPYILSVLEVVNDKKRWGLEGVTLRKLSELEEVETRGGRSLFRWSE